MPKPGRPASRWGLPAIGLAAVACVGCCALPLLVAGSIVGGGLALLRDSCFAPLAILLLVVGVATSALWIRRQRTKDNKNVCGEGADCGCAPEDEPEMLQPTCSEQDRDLDACVSWCSTALGGRGRGGPARRRCRAADTGCSA